jgi:hypothetical protein
MRKLISLFLIFSLNSNAASTGYKSEQSSSKIYAQDLIFPNNQLTKQAGLDSRIETGNQNLLVNPSFEHVTVSTGWTATNATPSADITNQVEGKKALSLSLSGIFSFSQVSTINAANIVGLQGMVSAYVKTSLSDVSVCSMVNSAEDKCIVITGNNSWQQVQIPFIMNGTNNGIKVKTTSSTTGTILVDNAFVGLSSPFQNVNGAQLLGTVVITGCASNWQTSGTIFADFSVQTGCNYVVSGSALAPSTMIPAIKFASMPAGDYRIEYEGMVYNLGATNKGAYAQFSDGTNTARETSALYLASANVSSSGISQSISYNTTQSNVTLSLRGKVDSTGSLGVYGTNTFPGTIKVWYFPPQSRIYSTASQDTDWVACSFTSLAWQGLGTVTNNLKCKKQMGDLHIKGKWTAGTVAASIAQIPLPNNWGTITTSSTINANQVIGREYREAAATSPLHTIITSPSVSVLNLSNSIIAAATNPATPVNGSAVIGTSEVVDIDDLVVPINEWTNYGVIVGSFAGIEKCANDYECTSDFSAYVSSAGVVSGENIDWINGNAVWSPAGTATITLNTNLKDGVSGLSNSMNCFLTSDGSISSTPNQFISTISTTTVVMKELSSTNGTAFSGGFYINCKKVANDYRPSTAKIATSIGVPTVPGILTTGAGNSIDTFSVSYGATATTSCTANAPCAYNDTIGTTGNFISHGVSTGIYTLNTSKTYSKLKCTVNCYFGTTGVCITTPINCSTCSTTTFTNTNYSSGATGDSYGTLYCQGTY